jgi:hypothetical protein
MHPDCFKRVFKNQSGKRGENTMWWWLDDILHEIGTVAFGAFCVFGLGALLGRFLQKKISLFALRPVVLVLGAAGASFLFFLFVPDEIEHGLVSEIFLSSFFWGVLTCFEKRWIGKELFSRDFWFPENVKTLFCKITKPVPQEKRNGG